MSHKPTIVVGHSLFMREFCTYFMDPDLADTDPIAMRLTRDKLANACMVKLDLEFDDENMDEIVRIVGVTPVLGMEFHSKEHAVDSRRGGASLAATLCCCLKKPEDDGEEDTQNRYANPLQAVDSPPPELRMSRRVVSSS